MIQTDVKELGPQEYLVTVTVAQSEYDRIYGEKLKRLSTQVKMPGFRPGKTPVNHLKKQFAGKLHEDTVNALLQTHFIGAIEASELKPAAQPELAIPADQPDEGFAFTMKVSTWPEVELVDLGTLKFDETIVEVEESDVDQVIDRLMNSQVKYEVEEGRAAEQGDQLHIDFVGSIDGEEFDGGKGEDVPLVLGEGRFIPGFEEQLIGAKAGDDVTVNVTFPEDYQAPNLAGKDASFACLVKSVGRAEKPADEDALAALLKFDSAEDLRADSRKRLEEEAREGSYTTTREAAIDALIEAHPMELPAALIEQDQAEMTKRVVENMKHQGVPNPEEMAKSDEFKEEIRIRSLRGLKTSVLLQKVRDVADLQLEESEVEAEIDRQSLQYGEQREGFKAWIKTQKEQIAMIKDSLLERKCVEYVIAQADTTPVKVSLSDWQDARDRDDEE